MTNKKTKDVTPAVLSPVQEHIKREFTARVFQLIQAPSPELGQEGIDNFLNDRGLATLTSQGMAYILSNYDVESEQGTILATINLVEAERQVCMNSPLKKWAAKLDGRVYGDVLSLEECIELNKQGLVVIMPQSDDLLYVYGIGEKAETVEDQMLEFGAIYKEDDVLSCFLTGNPSKYFLSADDGFSVAEYLGRADELLGNEPRPFPFAEIRTYADEDGFIITAPDIESESFLITEEGGAYGRGIVIAT